MLTAMIVYRWGNRLADKHRADCCHNFFHPCSSLGRKHDFAPSPGFVVKDGPTWYILSQHFLKTHCLSTELQIVILEPSIWPRFVFDGIGSLSVKFDNVSFPNQT